MNSFIRIKNLSSLLPAHVTITSCICSVYCCLNNINGTFLIYRDLKPWDEGNLIEADPGEGEGCTWNDWSADSKEWTTEGASCADDDGIDNIVDDGDCDASTNRDRKVTAEDTIIITAANTWYDFNISPSLAQGWYEGTISENGVILVPTTGFDLDVAFHSTEYTVNVTKQLFWTITYTVGYMRIKDDWRFRSSYVNSTDYMRTMDWRFQDSGGVTPTIPAIAKIYLNGEIVNIYKNGEIWTIFKYKQDDRLYGKYFKPF
jgi:hypothetical protein